MRENTYSEDLKVPLSHGNLIGIVRSHGWSQLAPYYWDEKSQILNRIERFKQQVVHLKMEQGAKKEVRCLVSSRSPLSSALLNELSMRLQYMLNYASDFSQFMKKARLLDPEIYRIAKKEINPLLRGSSLFEDVLKTLFTTNASWAYTKKMCQSFLDVCTKYFGWAEAEKTFPSVSQVLSIPMAVLESEGRLGYRTKYLCNISTTFKDCNEFVGWSIDPILQRLSTIKGLGGYSINHVAMLLGKNDKIPIDSEVRRCMRILGRSDQKKSIEEYYAPWAPYQNLAYRFERKIRQV